MKSIWLLEYIYIFFFAVTADEFEGNLNSYEYGTKKMLVIGAIK